MQWISVSTFLLLELHVHLLASTWVASAPSIAVSYPENHSVWPVDLATGMLGSFPVKLAIHGFEVPRDGVLRVTGDKIGEYSDGFVASKDPEVITFDDIESGSHFWRFALVHVNGSVVGQATLHVDVVVPQRHSALPQWRYTLNERERRRRVLFNLPYTQEKNSTHQTRKHTRQRICFMGSTAGQFDGQKKIWLQAIGALPRSQWDVQFVSFHDIVETSAFAQELSRLNVPMRGIPLTVRRADLEADNTDPSDVMPRLVQAFEREFSQASTGVSIHTFRQRVQNMKPPFASDLWQRVVDSLHDSCADAVLAFASSTGAEDRLLVESARIAGVRAIAMELANLRAVPVRVDALVGPSHYALNHPNIAGTVEAHQRYVLTTGINTELLRPRPQHNAAADDGRKLFTIGYVGRLATEKSLGLFLRAARLIAMSCRAKCRFRIIGDGPQREPLEALAEELGISDFVEFAGAIHGEDALVEAFQELDVLLSLCFHETLGIAALEAMSCGVPVIAFESGGVGEYLEHDVNGLTVESATAEAVRDSVMTLYRDGSWRKELGRNARRTVVERFSYETGAQQYVTLYERLARHSRH